jgi:TonB family protein
MRTPLLLSITLGWLLFGPMALSGSAPARVITGPELLQVFIVPRPPTYPYEARRNNWSGRGVYRAFVTPEGKVSRVTVLHSTGHPVMDETVITAALHWHAKPGRPREVDFPIIFVAPGRGTLE